MSSSSILYNVHTAVTGYLCSGQFSAVYSSPANIVHSYACSSKGKTIEFEGESYELDVMDDEGKW